MNQEMTDLKQGIVAEIDKLKEQVKSYKDRANQLKNEIVSAEQAITDARTDYDEFMGQGERVKANESFDKIKPLRQKAASLYQDLVRLESVIPGWGGRWTELLKKVGQLRLLANEVIKKAEKEHLDITVFVRPLFEGISPVDGFEKDLQNCIGQLKQDYY